MWGIDHISENFSTRNIADLIDQTVSQPEFLPPRDGGHTPMHAAAKGGHLAVLQALVNTGKANLEVKNGAHCSCLQIACRHGHVDIVQYLIEVGAKVTCVQRSDICMVEKCDDDIVKKKILSMVNEARLNIGLPKLK